jgi:membrane fusion protein (multidrug efflux system)
MMKYDPFKIFLSMIILGLTLVGCSDDGQENASQQASEITQAVEVKQDQKPIQITRGRRIEIEKSVFASGSIAAKQTSHIGPLVEGVIEKIFVKVGDRVKAGTALFQTRQVDYKRRLEEAKAAMSLADILGVQAKRNYERARKLAEQSNISQARLDDIRTAYQIADAKIRQAKVAVETAEQQLTDTVVKAPFDGVITGRNVDEGVYLSNRFSMGGSSAVVRIQEISIVGAIVQTPEKNLSLLAVNQPAIVKIQGHDKTYDSFVYVLNDLVDPTTRTIELRLPIENDDYAIKPGQFAEARILLPRRDALVIGRNTLRSVDENYFVFVARENIATQVAVEVREYDAEQVEITDGLKEQEMVIVNPSPSLKDGDKLRQLIVLGEN